jgi:MFS family permease
LALTSIGCAVAVNLTLMLAMRFVQGIGASACLLMAAAIAADRFRGAKLVSVLGLLGAAWGSAPVLAPAVGGFIVQHGSWRLVFVLFAVTVAAVALLVAKAMPERSQEPLGWFYVGSGVAFVVILLMTVRVDISPAASCSTVPSRQGSPR